MMFLYKVQLKGVSKPPVWRKIAIPPKSTFMDFHHAIQDAFDWCGFHLFEFVESLGGGMMRYGFAPWRIVDKSMHDDIEFVSPDAIDADEISLAGFVKDGFNKFYYRYDFGDDWELVITFEGVDVSRDEEEPVVVDSKGAPPPEDCGGIWGFENIRRLFDEEHEGKVSDPEELANIREWLGMESDEETWDKFLGFCSVKEYEESLKKKKPGKARSTAAKSKP